MRIAVLPFNAVEGTSPALARQLAFFISEVVRAESGFEVAAPRFQTQVEEDGVPRTAYVNVADVLLEEQMLDQMQGQLEPDVMLDGLLKQDGDNFTLNYRITKKDGQKPFEVHETTFDAGGVFKAVGGVIKALLTESGSAKAAEQPEILAVGTENGAAFLKFVEAYDSIVYIQESQGRMTKSFSPKPSFDMFLEALALDKDFEAPYESLVQLARMCAQGQIGTFDDIRDSLNKAIELVPEDYKAHFALGELFGLINDGISASSHYEKAISLEPNEASLYTRLGLAQMQAGMPVNAERNLRKAIAMEADDKPSLDFLANLLTEMDRGHEVPGIYKEHLDKSPNDPNLIAKYAVALVNNGKAEEGEKVFEDGLHKADDTTMIKRIYAPYLASAKQEYDRALDFYEDAIDATPTDVVLLLEYVQTLDQAGREVDMPEVLNQILSITPDPNIRAQTMARLIEIEQPKRVEGVQRAEQKIQDADFEGAARELKPLKTWLGDYWKFWYVYSIACNANQDYEEAEESSKRLLNMYPACDVAFEQYYQALHGQGKTEEAYNTLRFAAMNLPPTLPLHVTLARAAKETGRTDEARAIARQIREAVGENMDLELLLQQLES